MVLVISAFSTPALAHRVLVFAFVEGDVIRTESKFIPDTPVHQGKVEVLDKKNGKVLLQAKPIIRKIFFKIPPEAVAQGLDLEFIAGGHGHRGHGAQANGYLARYQSRRPCAAGSRPGGSRILHLNQQELDAALDKALERQLAPIKETLGKMSAHRTSPADIIGGLGYLMGIFGLLAYFKSKKNKNP
jgi:nickel transport protein